FDDDPHDLVVGPVCLPTDVGEIRDAGNIPNPSTVHAVTPDAIPVKQAHHGDFLLLRTMHPEPVAAVHGCNLTRRKLSLVVKVLVKKPTPWVISSHARSDGQSQKHHERDDRGQTSHNPG